MVCLLLCNPSCANLPQEILILEVSELQVLSPSQKCLVWELGAWEARGGKSNSYGDFPPPAFCCEIESVLSLGRQNVKTLANMQDYRKNPKFLAVMTASAYPDYIQNGSIFQKVNGKVYILKNKTRHGF